MRCRGSEHCSIWYICIHRKSDLNYKMFKIHTRIPATESHELQAYGLTRPAMKNTFPRIDPRLLNAKTKIRDSP